MKNALKIIAGGSLLIMSVGTQADIIHADDVIINGGSSCTGFDCVNGESFGFDTIRLKENNLRIHFQDTSTSASFPSNDWRIIANDSSNGGGNYLAIEDSNTGRQVFRVDAGAPANALRVDSQGDVGIGTANPVVDLHVVTGNTPTLRLEQNGTSGFTPQTWDLAGNETNFFIRDATNGSALPFRIRPGAPTSTIDVSSAGLVGLGEASPEALLHLRRGGAGDTGLPRIFFENTDAAANWTNDVDDAGVYRISKDGSGAPELSLDNTTAMNGTCLRLRANDTASNMFCSVSSAGAFTCASSKAAGCP